MKESAKNKLILFIMLLISKGFNSPFNHGHHYGNSNRNRNCYESCKECSGWIEYDPLREKWVHNCIKCENGYYRLGESNCYSIGLKNDGYYLYKKDGIDVWGKCYERCKTCDEPGNFTHMKCTSCDYYYIDYNFRKKFKYKLTSNKNCERCESDNYLTMAGDCLDKCPNGSYSYSFERSCLTDCPNNYKKDESLRKCVITTFEQNTPLEEFKSQITENITRFSNYTSLINGSDFTAIILTSSEEKPERQLEKGISAIDLSNCTQIIKEENDVPINDSLIILNMESKINNIKNIEIEEGKEEKEIEDKSFNLGKFHK